MTDKPSDLPRKTKNGTWAKAGIGIGIGSAAIVAALLYVNHAKKKSTDRR